MSDDLDEIKELIENKFGIDYKDESDNSILIYCCYYNNLKLIQYLVERYRY